MPLDFNSFFDAGTCTNRDISISQIRESSTGIPQYIVQIVNTCMTGCAPSNIHLHCGWFASAKIVNPRTFKRVSYDDCLVNEGLPLRNSQIIRFTYSNSFMYPLQFKSARFCWNNKKTLGFFRVFGKILPSPTYPVMERGHPKPYILFSAFLTGLLYVKTHLCVHSDHEYQFLLFGIIRMLKFWISKVKSCHLANWTSWNLKE